MAILKILAQSSKSLMEGKHKPAKKVFSALKKKSGKSLAK